MRSTDYSSQVIRGTYYPHVDGVRALAVLPVLLFHVLSPLCPGGFAGVDVFFVISGYLIAGGIWRDLEEQRFTIRRFYHRRIRRILPAYFGMIAAVFAAGIGLYYALPLIGLSDAVCMGTLFSSNLFFHALQSDYFAVEAKTNPLLHLWSLSVEEQFYLIIPLLCSLLWKLRRRWLLPSLIVLAAGSLVGAVLAVQHGRGAGAFYLLHYRAWELLAGVIVSLLPAAAGASPETDKAAAHRGDALAGAGLALVLAPYALLSENRPFPGLTAIPSVVGTLLLIRYGHAGWVGRLLAWTPLVSIGKISYSLYLWHWPVVVFWHYATYEQLHTLDYLGMLAASLALGQLSCRCIEWPVRRSAAWTQARSFRFAAVSAGLMIGISLACSFSLGWPDTLHAEANRLANAHEFHSRLARVADLVRGRFLHSPMASGVLPATAGAHGEFHRLQGDFRIGAAGPAPEVLLIGDSHAAVLGYGLHVVLSEQQRAGLIMYRTASGEIPDMFDLESPQGRQVLVELERQPAIRHVLLASRWSHHQGADSHALPRMSGRLHAFSERMRSMNRALYVIADVPEFDFAPNEMAARLQLIPPRQDLRAWREGWQDAATFDHGHEELNGLLASLCRETGAVFVPLHVGFAVEGGYSALRREGGQVSCLYRDGDHLSQIGSVYAARLIQSYLAAGGPSAGATAGLSRSRKEMGEP